VDWTEVDQDTILWLGLVHKVLKLRFPTAG